MTLAQIRQRVNTLNRKFALALSVVRARRVAERACLEWNRRLRRRQTPARPLPGGRKGA